MDKEQVVEGGRSALRRFDDGRRVFMLRIWGWVGGSPQKAGWFALFLVVVSFLLGRWSK